MACVLKVTAGEVEVVLKHADHEGRCLLEARARRLLAVATASALTQGTDHSTHDADSAPDRAPIGFTASVERADPVDLTPGWYDDEE